MGTGVLDRREEAGEAIKTTSLPVLEISDE